MRATVHAVLGVAFLALPSAAQAPLTPAAPQVPVTVQLLVGNLQGTHELSLETEFKPALAYGGRITYWAMETVGIAVHALRSSPEVSTQDLSLSLQDPDIWLIGADLVVGTRLGIGGGRVMPYATVGLGTKRFGFEDPYYAPAVNFGGGLAVDFGTIGMFAEAGPVFSELHRLGFWEGQTDLMFGGGISVSLGA